MRIGLILKAEVAQAGYLLSELVPFILRNGHVPVFSAEDRVNLPGSQVVPQEQFGSQVDLAVVLGGDGTMLRASALVADAGIPVLGINLGRLGFLTPFDPKEAEDALLDAVRGKLQVAERSRLLATFSPKQGPVERVFGLNDVVIHQGAMARLLDVQAKLGGRLVASYRADGIIVCTPTGSTAYNLAAGGPILVPGQEIMAITPICAHGLTLRPLVVEKGVVSLSVAGNAGGAMLTVDGQWGRSFTPGDVVDVSFAEKPLLVFESEKNYFDILREKLHWGAQLEKSENSDD